MYVRLKGMGAARPVPGFPRGPRVGPPPTPVRPAPGLPRGMGDVCTVDRYGNRVCGPSMSMGVVAPTIRVNPVPVRVTAPARSNVRLVNRNFITSVAAARNPTLPPWGGWNPIVGGQGATVQQTGIMATDLANLISIYQSNPAMLTQAQWTTLQNAGIIASTLPYSSASSLAPGAGLPGAAASSSSGPYTPTVSPDMSGGVSDFFSNQYGPLTGLEWIGVAAAAYFLFMRKGR